MNDDPLEHADVAVALKWDGKTTPRITAKGEDDLAQRIIDLAEEAGVTRYPDPELAPVLAQIPVGDEIPDALFRAVAEVIAFAYWVSGKLPDEWPKSPPAND